MPAKPITPDGFIANIFGYKLPPQLPPVPALEQLRNLEQKNKVRLRAKKPADMRATFASLPSDKDKKLILELQARCEGLIAVLRANDNDVVRRRFDDEVAAFTRNPEDATNLSEVSLAEQLAAARQKRAVINAAIRQLVITEVKPLCIRILKDALRMATVEYETAVEVERSLWSKYGIPWEESELYRSLRDAKDNLAGVIDSNLQGLEAGEATPIAVLKWYQIYA